MSFLWFLVAVTFFVLWLGARSEGKSRTGDGYGQGYWDGYRAFGDKATKLLGSHQFDKRKLQRLIDEGNGVAPSGANARSDVWEEAGIIPEGVDEYDDKSPRTMSQVVETAAPTLTAEELAAEKEKQTMKNLNLLLYVGSFLIVAAAALFVTLVMPASIKLGSLILVTLAFYVSGIVLHTNSSRLRPAAGAFVGTGLAILPFVGFALTSLGGMSGEAAWFATSIIGLAAYGFAAVRLQSQLVSYLTMAFVLSLAMSAVSTLGLSMVWYFIVVIGVSLICNSLHILWPRLMPKIFAQPIEQTGQITTPIALTASLFVVNEMELYMYEILYGVATAHYLVVWLEKRQIVYEVVVRALAHITLLIVVADISHFATSGDEHARVQFGVWFLALAVVQAIYSLLRVRRENHESWQAEQAYLVASLTMIVVGMTWWIDVEQASRWTALSLTAAGLVSLGAVLRLRQAGWGYVGLVASILLPYVVGRGVVEPKLSYEVLAGGFTIAGLFALMALERLRALGRSQALQSLLTVAVAAYALLIVLSGYLADNNVTVGWTTLLGGSVFVLLSYLLRAAVLELVAALAGLASVAAWVIAASVETQWQVVVTVVITTTLALAVACIHHFRQETERRNYLTAFGAIIFAGLVLVMGGELVVARTAVALLLAGGVAAMALRFVLQSHAIGTLTQIARLAYAGLPLAALVVSIGAGLGWLTLVLSVATALLWLSSYIEKVPAVMLVGNLMLVCTLTSLWSWLEFDSEWQLYGVAWLSAAVFYVMYWLMVDKRDTWRQWASLGSVWMVLGVATVMSIFDSDPTWVMASAGSLVVGAITLAVQGYLSKKREYIEIALYITTFGLQRMVSILLPETNLVAYGHWWAITIGLMAWWHMENYRVRAMVALGFVTGSTGLYALMGMEGYPLVFLVEHLMVVAMGAVLRQQWALWWGIVSVVLAVLYFLRGFTFLALLFLGFLLILFVIWRLGKMGKK